MFSVWMQYKDIQKSLFFSVSVLLLSEEKMLNKEIAKVICEIDHYARACIAK